MDNLVWESVEVRQSARRSGEAFVSIGQGRLALNADACDLIKDIYSYEWVDVIQARNGKEVVKIGLRFTSEKGKNSLKATRRKYKGEDVDGININSKQLVKRYFGETKETSTSRFSAEKVDDNTMAIDILKEL